MDLDSSINNLPVDLTSIKIERNNILIEGKGMIYNKEDNSIALKIFIDKNQNFNPLDYLINEINIKPGEVINDDKYFKFEGESLSGEIFKCEKVFLFDYINDQILNASLADYLIISSDPDFTDYKIGKIIIPDEISIPKNRAIEMNRNYSDKWRTRNIGLRLFETTVDEIDIDVLSEHSKTVIFFQTKTQKFSSRSDIRPIIDSLGFISSTIIDIYDIEFESHKMSTTKKILCHRNSKYRVLKMNYPPLHFSHLSIEQCEYCCDLFNRFFLFMKQEDSSELSYAIKKVISSANYITNYALTLTSSIESLSKEYFSQYAKPIDPNQVSIARQKIIAIDINKEIRDRIVGMLGNIVGQIRAKDILVNLCKAGVISKEENTAWTRLRNSSAHGDRDQSPFQDYYNLCSINLMLFYKMIFAIINYKGLFTNYSKFGYPIENLNNNAS